jgi:hypothetical protein
MLLNILGDSISTYDYIIPIGNASAYPFFDVDEPEKTWWGKLLKYTDWSLGRNDSYSGARITKAVPWMPSWSSFTSPKRIKNVQGADVLIVFGGTNDFGTLYLLPTMEEFKRAYTQLLDTILFQNPNTYCCFCTPIQRTDIPLETPNRKGVSLLDIQNCMRTLIQERDKALLIDLGKRDITAEMNCLNDGLHPNAKGMNLIGDWVIEDLKKLNIIH